MDENNNKVNNLIVTHCQTAITRPSQMQIYYIDNLKTWNLPIISQAIVN